MEKNRTLPASSSDRLLSGSGSSSSPDTEMTLQPQTLHSQKTHSAKKDMPGSEQIFSS